MIYSTDTHTEVREAVMNLFCAYAVMHHQEATPNQPESDYSKKPPIVQLHGL